MTERGKEKGLFDKAAVRDIPSRAARGQRGGNAVFTRLAIGNGVRVPKFSRRP
jgi:hypothetical protein